MKTIILSLLTILFALGVAFECDVFAQPALYGVSASRANGVIVGLTTTCAKCPWIDPDCDSTFCYDGPGANQCQEYESPVAGQEETTCTGEPGKKCVQTDYDKCQEHYVCTKAPSYSCGYGGPLAATCTNFHTGCTLVNTSYSYDNCDTQSMP